MKTEQNKKITIFDKATGDFIERVPIEISLANLEKIIIAYDGDPHLIMEYELDLDSALQLRPYTNLEFNFDKYDYFIGGYKPLVDGQYVR